MPGQRSPRTLARRRVVPDSALHPPGLRFAAAPATHDRRSLRRSVAGADQREAPARVSATSLALRGGSKRFRCTAAEAHTPNFLHSSGRNRNFAAADCRPVFHLWLPGKACRRPWPTLGGRTNETLSGFPALCRSTVSAAGAVNQGIRHALAHEISAF